MGKKAVIVGAESVGLSALLTLAMAGIKVARITTELPNHQFYFPYVAAKWALADIWPRTQISTSARVTRIDGGKRVEAVEITLSSGKTEVIECDTVIFTGNWIPQNELARSEGITLDAGTKGPRVDGSLRTSTPGVFAAGNLLRGVETADWAALEGRFAAARISDYLGRGGWPGDMLPIEVADPIEWVSPNAVSVASVGAPLGHVLLRVKTEQHNAVVQVRQGERLLHSQRFGRLRPNTSSYLADEWMKQVEAEGAAVRISLG